MPSKVVSIEAAVAPLKAGQVLGIGGMTLYRRPLGLVREIIRQRKRGLTLLGLTLGLEGDLLLAEECGNQVRTCYFGLESLGLAPHFRRKAQKGEVNIIEETEATIVYGLTAAAANLSFLPFNGLFGTDIPKVRPDLKKMKSPYGPEKYYLLPAIKPDVALLHVPLADAMGNAILGGQKAIDSLLAITADYTVISAEAMVSTQELEQNKAELLGCYVDAVVHLPWGAHPSSCYPYYRVDIPHLVEYLEASEAEKYGEYRQQYLNKTFDDYFKGVIREKEEELRLGSGHVR